MLNRWRAVVASALFVLSGIGMWGLYAVPGVLHAQQEDALKEEAFRKRLKTILEKDLRASTKQEKDFIKLVVARVKEGTLPLKLVVESYSWARQKHEHRVQYFMRGLKSRAKKRGINL